jgi:hypothetical protein
MVVGARLVKMFKSASEEEAVAVAAAIERFAVETAVAVEVAEAVGPWQRAALIEGVGAKGTVQDPDEGGARWLS